MLQESGNGAGSSTNHTFSLSDYHRGIQRVLLLTLLLNLIVVVGKLIAGFMAGSLSVISDAIHSSVDSLNNIVGLVVMRFATAEADDDHPYGHGKFETLAAFVIAGFLFVTCYQLGGSALQRLFRGQAAAPEITSLTIGVMVATILVNIIVTVYEQREGNRLKSDFLIADAIHTRSDVVVSVSILIGLLFVRRGYVWLDSVLTLLVAVVIAWNGYKIFKATVPILVDAAPVPAHRIADIVENVPGVHSVHDIRSRGRAGEMFIEMHLHISPEIEHDHVRAHEVTEIIEQRLEQEFGRVRTTIHVEPTPES
ncbi:MAG: cation diffusion facilitator family transporter [Blastocatellia bacterium]|nr:cation diffusion facilitator family transporter [Blastocatellia bacterium]